MSCDAAVAPPPLLGQRTPPSAASTHSNLLRAKCWREARLSNSQKWRANFILMLVKGCMRYNGYFSSWYLCENAILEISKTSLPCFYGLYYWLFYEYRTRTLRSTKVSVFWGLWQHAGTYPNFGENFITSDEMRNLKISSEKFLLRRFEIRGTTYNFSTPKEHQNLTLMFFAPGYDQSFLYQVIPHQVIKRADSTPLDFMSGWYFTLDCPNDVKKYGFGFHTLQVE